MVGVIAQEIKEVLPSTISVKKTEHYDDLLQYDSSELLYTLINAIKELNEKVDNLERENQQLHINLVDLRLQLNRKNP